MANQKLTELTSASTPLSGSEQVYVVQSGNSRKATAQQLADVPGEWSGETVSQAEAEAGTATTRRAWTAQRVFQAVAAWWGASAAAAKLAGIQAGATANATDAQLRDRSTHTGTQAAGTITGLATVATTGAYADLSDRPTLGTAAATDATAYATAAQGAKADTAVQPAALSSYVQANDSRLSDARTPTAHTQTAATISDSTTAGRALLTAADAGAQRTALGLGTAATASTGTSAGNVPVLDGSGLMPAALLPSYVDDVLEAANLAAFPAIGETGKIYVARDTNKTYRWSGSAYVEISASPGSTDAVPEGSVNLYFSTGRASAAAPVQSVAGKTGSVTLSAGDISGLGTLATQSGTFSGTSSGVNTGDQTITLTGDVTGSGTGSFAATLANTTVSAAAYGSASAVGTFTVDAKGRLTAAANVNISIPSTAISDSTAAGRALLTGADAAAQRTSLSAAASGSIGSSGLTMATARLLGRSTAGTGAPEEITLGTGLSFSGTTLNAAAGSPGGTSGQLQWNSGGTFAGLSTSSIDGSGNLTLAGRLINSLNGAASAPPLSVTGTWFTGGTATTTKPQLLVEPAGTTSTAWSTSGTGLGVNAPSGFAGNLLDLQKNGTSQFLITNSGRITASPSAGNGNGSIAIINATTPTHGLLLGGSCSPSFNGNGFYPQGSLAGGTATPSAATDIGFTPVNGISGYSWRNVVLNGSLVWDQLANAVSDLVVTRDAAGILAQRNSTNAQTFRIYNTYTSATNYELGKLEWSSNVFRIGTEKGSGGGTARAVEVHTDSVARLALDTTGSVRVVTGLTVATLPGTPAVGMIARVTDATAPVVGSAVTGGGSAAALVWYNGTAWNVIGV